MLGSIRSDAYGGLIGRSSALAPQAPVSEAAPVRAVSRQSEPKDEAGEKALMQYLGNITRADASAVIALTQPSRQGPTASYGVVASAYEDF